MLRLTKRLAWAGLLAAGLQGAGAFSLLGPGTGIPDATWQIQDNGFNVTLWADIGGPMNIAEEYRRNVPVLYYAFDSSFSDYFGSNGLYAVDQAFATLNATLSTNVSSWSSNLTEFPIDTRRINYTAASLSMMDVRSFTLSLMMEQLGLASPVRYIWDIHDRYHDPAAPACPLGMEYLVVKRNYDIAPSALDQLQYSSYVNGALYSYYIHEFCASPPAPAGWPLAQAIPIPVDPLSGPTAVADYDFRTIDNGATLNLGSFYTGLTRDDAGGLRYLYRSGNVNWESTSADSTLLFTNTAATAQQLLITSNLTLLAAQSFTNSDAALLTLYPDLVIASTTPAFTNVVTTNYLVYYTNYPWNSSSSTATLVTNLTYDTNVLAVYLRSFSNVITNSYSANGQVTVLTTNVSAEPWALPGTLVTNVTRQTMRTNIVVGDYYVIPTNACGVQIISTQLVKLVTFTNVAIVSTNFVSTNTVTSSSNGPSFSLSFIYYFTNYQFIVYPVSCLTSNVGLRRGIETIRFVRQDFDSLLGRAWGPVTNLYTSVAVTNSTNWVQTLQRVATQPDFVFQARDFLPGPAVLPGWFDYSRSINFNTANHLAQLSGPGTIESPTVFAFNKAGPTFVNQSPSFMDELSAFVEPIWGSFDESTNAPVIYANGVSIAMLENMTIMQITTASLPPGQAGLPYTASLAGSGGTPPYTWSLSPGSPGLPPGLVLNAGGTLSGTPPAADSYDFTVRLSDAAGRFVDRPLALTVTP